MNFFASFKSNVFAKLANAIGKNEREQITLTDRNSNDKILLPTQIKDGILSRKCKLSFIQLFIKIES